MKRKTALAISFSVAIPVALGLAAIAAYVFFASRDIPAPDVSDLRVSRPEVPPEENAYTHFLAAADALRRPKDSALIANYLAGRPADSNAIATAIEENTEALNLIGQGIALQRCITPEVTGIDTEIPTPEPWLQLGRILAARSRRDRLAGRYEEATQACLSLLRFADLVQQDAEGILNFLVGIAILDLGLAQARDLARDPDTPSPELAKLADALDGLGPFEPGLVRAIRVEYRIADRTIEDLVDGAFTMEDFVGIGDGPRLTRRGQRIPGYLFQPNRTRLMFAELYRDMIENASLPYAEMNLYAFEERYGLSERKGRDLLRPNAVGRILYEVLAIAMDRILERKCRADGDLAATRLLVGLHRYRRAAGAFPERVQDLVPAYMDTVPIDPFDGHPFRYDRGEGVVYSVGRDGTDSGGSTVPRSGDESGPLRNRRWEAEDAVFPLEADVPGGPEAELIPEPHDQRAADLLEADARSRHPRHCLEPGQVGDLEQAQQVRLPHPVAVDLGQQDGGRVRPHGLGRRGEYAILEPERHPDMQTVEQLARGAARGPVAEPADDIERGAIPPHGGRGCPGGSRGHAQDRLGSGREAEGQHVFLVAVAHRMAPGDATDIGKRIDRFETLLARSAFDPAGPHKPDVGPEFAAPFLEHVPAVECRHGITARLVHGREQRPERVILGEAEPAREVREPAHPRARRPIHQHAQRDRAAAVVPHRHPDIGVEAARAESGGQKRDGDQGNAAHARSTSSVQAAAPGRSGAISATAVRARRRQARAVACTSADVTRAIRSMTSSGWRTRP